MATGADPSLEDNSGRSVSVYILSGSILLISNVGTGAFGGSFREHTRHGSFVLKAASNGCSCCLSEELHV